MNEKIITREIINKNIIFEDIKLDSIYDYDFKYLSKEIDSYKNLLEKEGAKPGESAIIGRPPGIDQISLIFACLELGISLSIIDYGRSDSFTYYRYMDPKTNILLPINYFIVLEKSDTDKFKFFNKHCDKTILLKDYKNKDYTKNEKINANPETIIMKCTSSGTTGTPKKVKHNHKFFYELIKRNALFFDKTVGMGFNLNHGSSLATYFLPAIHSEKVEKFINLPVFSLYPPIGIAKLDHLMVPYKKNLFVLPEINSKQTTYYTLSTIPSSLKNKDCYKDIISIFGSNETSGPVFINRINHKHFKENSYFKVDDFYGIDLVDKSLNVTLPEYNETINTKDQFYIDQNGTYIFLGRDDLTRINGQIVPLKKYDNITKENIDADLIYDYVFQEIYLAIWNDSKSCQKRIKRINKFMKNYSNGNHFIKKSKILKKEEFLSGIKLDQELLREYFRRCT